MFFSDDVLEEVRSRNDIVDVVSSYVKLQRRGSSYFGLCPFHSEKSPSFSVSPSKQMYYCFGCGAGGSVFNFIMEYENFTFPEAVRMLADRAGVALPEEEETPEARQKRDLKTSVLELNKAAARYYCYMLRTEQGTKALEYLKNRSLSDETIRRFGLGYAGHYSDNLYRYFKKQGISDQLLRESGLFQVNEKQGMFDKFWNRVMFPIMDINNKVIGFGGRVMGDARPKYLNSPETVIFDKGRNLYGLNYARSSKKRYMLVCEGYMDVIAMHQAGFTNAVASLGTALTDRHAALLKRYTDEVILTYDSDEAGIRAALRAIPLLREAGVSTRVLHMQPYKDPDEFIRALGTEAFQERIDQAENSFMFELSVLEKSFDMKDPDGKTKFYQAVADRIAGFELEIERENYIEAVVGKYHISFEGLRRMVMNSLMKGTPVKREQPVRPSRRPEKEDGIRKSQRILLTWLCEYPKLFTAVSKYVRPEDFSDELYREVATKLYEQLASGTLNPARITNHFQEPEQQRQVAEIFNTSVEALSSPAEQEKAVRETIRKILDYGLKQRNASLDPSDLAGLQSVLESKRKLQELSKLHISL